MKKLVLFVLTLLPTLVRAAEFGVENAQGVIIYYNYTNNGTELEVAPHYTDYSGYKGNIIIPEEVTYMNRTRKVTSIGYEAFYYCSELISVVMPNSITNIEGKAFRSCSQLTSISISENLRSIGGDAFRDCLSLTSLDIPKSVVDIGPSAFSGCSFLTSVTLQEGVKTIGSYAFERCFRLTSIKIPNSVITIGEYNQEIKGKTNVEIIPVSA